VEAFHQMNTKALLSRLLRREAPHRIEPMPHPAITASAAFGAKHHAASASVAHAEAPPAESPLARTIRTFSSLGEDIRTRALVAMAHNPAGDDLSFALVVLAEQNAEICSLRARLEAAKASEELRADHARLVDELDAARAEWARLRLKLSSEQHAASDLRAMLSTYREKADRYEHDNTALRTHLAKLTHNAPPTAFQARS
jgi:hypothetical protein